MFRVLVFALLRRGFFAFEASQLFRFVLVGVLNTAFSFSIYVFLINIGFHYACSNLLSLILGLFFSYATNGFVVFHNMSKKSLFRYIFVWVFLYVFQIFIIYLTISFDGNAFIGGGVALLLSVPISFFLQKYYVF